MVNSLHDISIYHWVLCESGDLKHLGFGAYKRARFKKLQKQLLELIGPNKTDINKAIFANFGIHMVAVAELARQSLFGTDEQIEKVRKMATQLGLKVDDPEHNEAFIERYYERINNLGPKPEDEGEGKETPLQLLYAHLAYVSSMLELGYLDSKKISVGEFHELIKLAEARRIQHENMQNNG